MYKFIIRQEERIEDLAADRHACSKKRKLLKIGAAFFCEKQNKNYLT